jgi:ferredoxin-NADP reductase
MKATFVRKQVENQAKNIVTFWFEPEKPLNQLAGQYLEMTLKHNSPDNRGEKRWFTLSNSPTEKPLISITTKFPEDKSSFKNALLIIKTGQRVSISDPIGFFVLPKDINLPLVFIAGGIGIVPFRSINKYLQDTGQKRDITLIYYVKNEQELIFQDLFDTTIPNRVAIVNNPSKTWKGEMGRLNGQKVLDIARPSFNALFYIAGSKPLVETLEKQLMQLGVDKSHLLIDYFPDIYE